MKEVKEREKGKAPIISALLQTAREGQFFRSACHYKEVHSRYVELHCAHTTKNLDAAMDELEAFLVANPDYVGAEGVREMSMSLRKLRAGPLGATISAVLPVYKMYHICCITIFIRAHPAFFA